MPSDENEDKGKGKKKEENSVDGSTILTYNDELLLVEEHDIVDSASSWVIDSSTSVHVTSRRDFFALILQVNWIAQISQQKR